MRGSSAARAKPLCTACLCGTHGVGFCSGTVVMAAANSPPGGEDLVAHAEAAMWGCQLEH